MRKRARRVTQADTTGDTSRVGSEQGPPVHEPPAPRKIIRPPRQGVEDQGAQRGGRSGTHGGKRSGVGVLKFVARVYPANSSMALVQEALRASFDSPLQVFPVALSLCVPACVSGCLCVSLCLRCLSST